jgi:hypothetical protein
MLKLTEEVVYIQKMIDKCCAQLWNEMCSLKMMKAEDEHQAHLRNETYSMKMRNEHYADLETKKVSLKKMAKAKEKCHAELQNEMPSLLMVMVKVEEI